MLIPLSKEDREKVAQWTVERYGGVLPDMYEALGFSHPSGAAGGAVFSCYDGHNINVNIAADSPLLCTRGNLKAGFRYAFIQLDCKRMTAIIKQENKRCRRLAEGLGFKLEGVIRNGTPDGDLFMYGLLKDEFMKGKFYARPS